jgi:hypothetical protein
VSRPLRRLLPAVRRIPLPLRLIFLVLAAALASLLTTHLRPTAETVETPNRATSPPASAPVVESASPALPVEEAIEAAQKGDIDGYLARFTDPLSAQLTRLRAEKGDAYLRDYLTRLTAPVRGITADLNRRESVGPDTIRLPIEFVYADHNEMQRFLLRQERGQWRISGVDLVRSSPTLIPYGTPIQELPKAPPPLSPR